MNLRSFLEMSGVSEKDLKEAVRDARQTTRSVARFMGVAEVILEKAEQRLLPGKKSHAAVVLAKKMVGHVKRGAQTMVNERTGK
jgi:hypothetical protein